MLFHPDWLVPQWPAPDHVKSVFTTRYGVLLLAKAGCMVLVAIIAVHVRRRVLPRVLQHKRTSLALWCGWEVVTLAAAFGIAVVLTRAAVTPF